MVELAGIKSREKSVDLGAGDGRILIAFAKAGSQAYGVEIDETLTQLIKHNIKRGGLTDKAFIFNEDLWKHRLDTYDIITVYGFTSVMDRLEDKIAREGKKGCRILANFFTFPHWKPERVKKNVYLYIKQQ